MTPEAETTKSNDAAGAGARVGVTPEEPKGREAPGARRGSLKGLVVLLGLLVLALRLGPVVMLADVFVYGEELEKAAAGKALLDGLGVEHWRLAYHYYEGGGFVVSHLDALAFLLVGPCLLALKLVAIGFNLAILAAGVVFLGRVVGRPSAVLFGLLFAFAPESVAKNSLLALGIHFEGLLFVLLILGLGARTVFLDDRRLRTGFLLGLSAGFGTYFSLPCAVTAAFVALAVLVRRPRAWIGAWLPGALVGTALGALPLFLMWRAVGDAVLDIHGASLIGNENVPPKAQVLGDFLRSVLAGRPVVDLVAIALLVLGPLIGLIAALTAPATASPEGEPAVRAPHPRGPALYLGAYLVLFAAAYLLSDFTIGTVYHYFLLHRLSQLWLLSILLAAVGLPVLLKGGWPVLGWGLVLGMLGFGAYDFGRVASQGDDDLGLNWEVLTRTKGYAYGEYVSKIAGHLEGERRDKLEVLLRFDEPAPAFLHQALAAEFYGDGSLPLDEVLAELTELGVDDPAGFLLGLWPPWKTGTGNDLAGRVRTAEARGGPWAEALVEAVGRYGLGALATEDRFERELAEGREQGFPPAYFRGLGYRAWSVRGDRRIQGYWNQVRQPWMLQLWLDGSQADTGESGATREERRWLDEGFDRAQADRLLR